MASLASRLNKAEQLIRQKRKPSSRPPKNDIFILPDDEKRFQACVRNAKKHRQELEWVAIILPAKKEIS